MDVTPILDPLNTAQRDAVSSSGKTRVLVHRIAWLMAVEGASPYNIMAVTFTNKTAARMRSRIEELPGIPIEQMG